MADEPRRRYASPLRERQAQQTRELILDTLTDLLGERRPDEITTRDLARAAGLSEGTVYRHFADRAALLSGLTERLEVRTGRRGERRMATADDLPAVARDLMQALDENYAIARAEALFNADPRHFSAATMGGTRRIRAALAASFPNLDARQLNELSAIVRSLLSAQSWLRMREEFGLDGAAAGGAVAWALDALFDTVRRKGGPGTTGGAVTGTDG